MPCYRPIPAWQGEKGGAVRLLPPVGTATMQLPCGKCIGCRKRRAKEWAVRAMHESKFHEFNSFITLTYDDDHLPDDGSLSPRDFTLFLKKFRKRMAWDPNIYGKRMRYLACGEYGDNTHRPHYHALMFGVGFGDKVAVGKELFDSSTLRQIWGKGHVSVGSVTPRSCMYVASYSVKKLGVSQYVSKDGVVLVDPFLRVSTRPGIGMRWLEKYATDTRHGHVVTTGDKNAVPRYYQRKLKEIDPSLYEEQRESAYANYFAKVRPTEMALVAGEKIAKRKFELDNMKRSL